MGGDRTKTRIARAGLVAALVGILALSSTGVASAGTGTVKNRREMLELTNTSRKVRNIKRVALDRRISDLARQHSLKMATRGDLFHTKDPARYYLKGISWRTWGENVGVTGGTLKDLQRAFMDSSSHRSNILNRKFRQSAIGAVRVDGLLWVTVFFYG